MGFSHRVYPRRGARARVLRRPRRRSRRAPLEVARSWRSNLKERGERPPEAACLSTKTSILGRDGPGLRRGPGQRVASMFTSPHRRLMAHILEQKRTEPA